jgi:hypothetical protein
LLEIKIRIFRCKNETELVIRLLIFDNKDSAPLMLLDDSDATLGPGLISIPDIINKIHDTKNRYLHISIAELFDVFCFILFARYGIQALPLMTFCSLFNFNARLPCEIRESVALYK